MSPENTVAGVYVRFRRLYSCERGRSLVSHSLRGIVRPLDWDPSRECCLYSTIRARAFCPTTASYATNAGFPPGPRRPCVGTRCARDNLRPPATWCNALLWRSATLWAHRCAAGSRYAALPASSSWRSSPRSPGHVFGFPTGTLRAAHTTEHTGITITGRRPSGSRCGAWRCGAVRYVTVRSGEGLAKENGWAGGLLPLLWPYPLTVVRNRDFFEISSHFTKPSTIYGKMTF